MAQQIEVPGVGVVEFPDGMTDDQITKAIKANSMMPRTKAKIETPQFEKDAAAIKNAAVQDLIAGHPVTRFALGAADLARGGAQFLGNLSPTLNMMGLGRAANENETTLQGMVDRGRAAYGSEGMDAMRLMGNVVNPVGLATAGVLGPAGSALGAIKQGATIGALSGAGTPVANAGGALDYAGSAGLNAGIGGVFGGVATGAVEGAKAVGRGVRNVFTQGTPMAGARLANLVAGPNAGAVQNAMANSADNVPGSVLTAGQAATPANSAEFAALQKIVENANPSKYAGALGVQGQQEAARRAVISEIANDPAFVNPSVDPIRAAKLVREANRALNYDKIASNKINPIAPEEVYAARIAEKLASKAGALQQYGQMATAAQQQGVLSEGGRQMPGQIVRNEMPMAQMPGPLVSPSGKPLVPPGSGPSPNTPPGSFPTDPRLATQVPLASGAYPSGPGFPRVPPRYTENIQRVPEFEAGAKDALTIASQRQAEANFLQYQMDSLIKTVGMENPTLAAMLQRPSMRKALEAAQEGAAESGGYFPKNIGDPFSVANLQRMKMALDDVIKDPKTFGIKATEAAEIGDTRAEFVKWIAKRSPGWDKFRKGYAADSLPINRMEIGRELEKGLTSNLGATERPGVFANAMENARKTQMRANGVARYDTIDEALGPEGAQKARSVMKDLLADAQYENLAKAGMGEARRITKAGLDVIPQVGMLDRAMMVVNNITRRFENVGSHKTLIQLGDMMQNPKEMARIMKLATPKERSELAAAILGGAPAALSADGRRQLETQ